MLVSLFAKRHFVELILAQSITNPFQCVNVVSKLLDGLDLFIKEARLNEIHHLGGKRKRFADGKRKINENHVYEKVRKCFVACSML